MSKLATESILARNASRALRGPFSAYQEAAEFLPAEPHYELSAAGAEPLLSLPMVTIASLRYVAPDFDEIQFQTSGIVTEASLRIAHWGRKSGRQTAHSVANDLESIYYPTGVSGWRRGVTPLHRQPRRGWALLAATDRLGLVEWWCDLPSPIDYRYFDTVRLKDALDALMPPQRATGRAE
ncbi:hypothetical protein [Microbacterium enclense]|uniref:hypothetical protein n=1 Tax=Microbacterium enclense TaxID=993073 RepID=UPI003F7F9874